MAKKVVAGYVDVCEAEQIKQIAEREDRSVSWVVSKALAASFPENMNTKLGGNNDAASITGNVHV